MAHKRDSEKGFSYIDVIIAIMILMVGILAMLGALSANLVRGMEAEQKVIAKQMALSTLESIISAKEIDRPGVIGGWDSLRNVLGVVPVGEIDGIFVTGWNPVREEMGWDGVAGTIDDACAATGPCVVAGRPDNNSPVLNGYQRQIVITDIEDPERPTSALYPISRRRIDVTVRYFVSLSQREQTASTIITNNELWEDEEEEDE